MKRRLDKSESLLWKAVTQDVTPLPGQRDESPEPTVEAPPLSQSACAVTPPVTQPVPKHLPPLPLCFDRSFKKQIQSDRMKIEARLDLHGLIQDEAYRALATFVGKCVAADVRLGLVITGKGRMKEGILRQNLPRWLDTPPLRSAVIAIQPALERHGGDGAYYVLFARRRKPS